LNFDDKYECARKSSDSYVCIGLDPDLKLIPEHLAKLSWEGIIEFNKGIINATAPFAAAYKLNLAFFEALGEMGWRVLSETLKIIPEDRLTIADGKRGDIGNSAKFYAQALFEQLNFDSVTVNPYMGYDAVEPFICRADKGAFILCLTSNPGAQDFQFFDSGKRLFEIVARKAQAWNKLHNIGLVTGATQAEQLKDLRKIAPDLPFLIPGIGAQGGDLTSVVENALRNYPIGGLINSSRAIIYASKGKDFARAAGLAAKNLREEIQEILIK
jgi:orotidine-5'-phosphate decarboxylase